MLAALAIPPLLHLVALDRLAGWLDRPARRPRDVPPDEVVAAWVTTMLRRLPAPWRYTCLRRSLVLFYLLRRAGRSVTLCIGVRRTAAGEFAAHAWLLAGETPYLEPEPTLPSDYTIIARFPEAPGVPPRHVTVPPAD